MSQTIGISSGSTTAKAKTTSSTVAPGSSKVGNDRVRTSNSVSRSNQPTTTNSTAVASRKSKSNSIDPHAISNKDNSHSRHQSSLNQTQKITSNPKVNSGATKASHGANNTQNITHLMNNLNLLSQKSYFDSFVNKHLKPHGTKEGSERHQVTTISSNPTARNANNAHHTQPVSVKHS